MDSVILLPQPTVRSLPLPARQSYCSRAATAHVFLNRRVIHVERLIELFLSSNSDLRIRKAGAQSVKRRVLEWEASYVGCCPTAGSRYDCRDEKRGGGPNEATGRQWMSSHATHALKTTPSLFHRQVDVCLAFKDATLRKSSIWRRSHATSRPHLKASCCQCEHLGFVVLVDVGLVACAGEERGLKGG